MKKAEIVLGLLGLYYEFWQLIAPDEVVVNRFNSGFELERSSTIAYFLIC